MWSDRGIEIAYLEMPEQSDPLIKSNKVIIIIN